MKDLVTVVVPVRNREAWKIETLVESFRNGGDDPSFLIVDTGSDADFAADYAATCSRLNVQYVHLYTEGRPWNKSHALNAAARLVTTKYYVLCDLDLIIDQAPLTYILKDVQPRTLYHYPRIYDVHPRTTKQCFYFGRWVKQLITGHDVGTNFPGGFQFLETAAFTELNGYDEEIEYWGCEDADWLNRLKKSGYTQTWLPDGFVLKHQEHPQSQRGYTRPSTVPHKQNCRMSLNNLQPAKNQDWGKIVTENDRPILARMKKDTPVEVTLNQNSKIEIPLADHPHGFFKITLGDRKRHLSKIQGLGIGIISFLVPKLKNHLIQLNTNLETLYEMLPALERDFGLKDWYLEDNAEVFWLLF